MTKSYKDNLDKLEKEKNAEVNLMGLKFEKMQRDYLDKTGLRDRQMKEKENEIGDLR